MIYSVLIILSIIIGFAIEKIVDKKYKKINKKRIDILERKIKENEEILKKMRSDENE